MSALMNSKKSQDPELFKIVIFFLSIQFRQNLNFNLRGFTLNYFFNFQ